MNKVLMWLFIY